LLDHRLPYRPPIVAQTEEHFDALAGGGAGTPATVKEKG
jgi:hypothetical protein